EALGSEPRPTAAPAVAGDRSNGRVIFDSTVPALEVRELSVAFGGNTAVDRVSMSVAPREVVGLIGPNGAGKTTLLDLISGFTAPSAGQVLLSGREITHRSASSRALDGIGRSFQDARLFPGLTVTETLSVSLERWIDGDGVISGAFRLPAALTEERLIRE